VRRVIAPFLVVALMSSFAGAASSQAVPPTPVASAGASETPAPAASALPSPTPTPSDASPEPTPSPAPPTPSPTPVPILVDPPAPGINPGSTVTLRVSGVFGALTAVVADPAVADVAIDQAQRTITITGRKVGATTMTVADARVTETRAVPIVVQENAGVLAASAVVRITGDPASASFIKDQAVDAAMRAVALKPGAAANASADGVAFSGVLGADDQAAVDVPLIVSGQGYFSVAGTTRVFVRNTALPKIRPARLLVSDYPETLRANGVLFTADLSRNEAQRFLYYHYNPKDQPDRRIVLRVDNPSNAPASVQVISGSAGPAANEMEVGHLATERYLRNDAQNMGTIVAIPPNGSANIVNAPLNAGTLVSAILQLRELDGNPLHLTLTAQNKSDPIDQPPATTELLSGGVAHARGEYSVPEFTIERSWNTDDDPLEIPIGQIPLPNLRKGEVLGGDYGVKQSVTITVVNNGAAAMPVAVYANPRGGRATGTFLIDRTLVRAHALPSFSKFKIREFRVPPHGFYRTQIVTMPEGGSSYPLRLIVAQDDGSVSPGAPGSPIY
jgi:hypothetical protein